MGPNRKFPDEMLVQRYFVKVQLFDVQIFLDIWESE